MYAKDTKVSSTRSLEQIKRLLMSVGAKEIQTAERSTGAAIQFQLQDRVIRFMMPLGRMEEFGTMTVRGRRKARTAQQTLQAWEQDSRRRWRALHAVIKGKLLSAQSGIETVEESFLANIVTNEGTTVWQDVIRKSAEGYLDASGHGYGLALPAGEGA
jgi:hypothetical protein